jgi:tetratricopeptide (TPR) repeat protein
MRFSTLLTVTGFLMFVGPSSVLQAAASDAAAAQSKICADTEGQADKRIAACTKLIERTTDNQRLADLYNNRGAAFSDKRDQGHALADFTRAINFDDGSCPPYVNRGDLFCRKGEFDRAIEDFSTAIRLQPSFERAYMGRTLAFLKKDDAQSALNSADEMIGHEPASAVAVETRAYVLKAIGRRDEAIAEYRKALQMASESPELQHEIESILHELGVTP